MLGFLNKETFPWWYSLVKWGIPLGLAIATGVGAGFILTGSVTMPAFFGMLKWAPAFFSTLEGFTSIAALGAATIAIASTVGVLTSFFIRGTLLFPLTEVIATNAQHYGNDLKKEKETLQERLRELTRASEEQSQKYEGRLTEVTNQYHELRGVRAAETVSVGKTKEKKYNVSNDTRTEGVRNSIKPGVKHK